MSRRIFIIAGEPSGDLHGSNLVREILASAPKTVIRAWGGDKMKAAGAEIVKHVDELAFMGFIEVVKNLPEILRNFKRCKAQVAEFRPDLVVLIDYPGFNLRMAKTLHQLGIPVVYYIAPQAWAWKEGRVKKIQKYVQELFVILPFEEAFFSKHGIHVTYVGHPLLDEIAQFDPTEAAGKLPVAAEDRVIAVLPGSREQELKKAAPLVSELSKEFSNHKILVSRVPWLDESLYGEFKENNVAIVTGNTYALLDQAEAAVVTSGTATLETALFNTPQVVVYRANALSIAIARRLVNIQFISLVNLIMGREVVCELIQSDATASNVIRSLKLVLKGGKERDRMLEDYAALREKLGTGGASKLVASRLLKIAQS